MLTGQGNKTSPVGQRRFIRSRLRRKRSHKAPPEALAIRVMFDSGAGNVGQYSVGFLPDGKMRQALRTDQGRTGKLCRTPNGHGVIFLLPTDHQDGQLIVWQIPPGYFGRPLRYHRAVVPASPADCQRHGISKPSNAQSARFAHEDGGGRGHPKSAGQAERCATMVLVRLRFHQRSEAEVRRAFPCSRDCSKLTSWRMREL